MEEYFLSKKYIEEDIEKYIDSNKKKILQIFQNLYANQKKEIYQSNT